MLTRRVDYEYIKVMAKQSYRYTSIWKKLQLLFLMIVAFSIPVTVAGISKVNNFGSRAQTVEEPPGCMGNCVIVRLPDLRPGDEFCEANFCASVLSINGQGVVSYIYTQYPSNPGRYVGNFGSSWAPSDDVRFYKLLPEAQTPASAFERPPEAERFQGGYPAIDSQGNQINIPGDKVNIPSLNQSGMLQWQQDSNGTWQAFLLTDGGQQTLLDNNVDLSGMKEVQ